jgi:hypothetical protein
VLVVYWKILLQKVLKEMVVVEDFKVKICWGWSSQMKQFTLE